MSHAIASQSRLVSSRPRLWTGRVLSLLIAIFMFFDASMKIILMPQVVEASRRIGFPVAANRPIGVILLICTVLFLIQRTSILGAVLLTGYLGAR